MSEQMPQWGFADQEKVIIDAKQEKAPEGANVLMDFIDEKYFENFLNKLDAIEESNASKSEAERVNIDEVGELLGVDIKEMRSFIDNKLPELVEKVHLMNKAENIQMENISSLMDVLGNSIITIFNRIIWVLENFRNTDPVVQEKIHNPQSITRKVIDLYSKSEGRSGVASYYINTLCTDSEKLKMEISTKDGFLQNYQEYFHSITMNGGTTTYFPNGGKKLAYFKFFNELESGSINAENLEKALGELDDKIIDTEKIRKSKLVKNTNQVL
ncbi:MAG: hypothetical protein WC823_05370 [Parcubacteria group bacterium]|jgi:hypothetical protein